MKQVKCLLTLAIGFSLLPSITLAHTLVKDEAVSLQAHNWTGYYAGLNMGAVRRSHTITDNQNAIFNVTLEQISNPKFIGGLQVGYRRQLDLMRVSGVYGVEFSANFADDKMTQDYGSPFGLYQVQTKNKLKELLMLQFTGGIAADKTLLFVAAGVAWANIESSLTNLDDIPFFAGFTHKKPFGTAVGVGIEYAFTDKISARIKFDVITPNAYSISDDVGNHYRISNNLVQGSFGVNYNFG